MAREEARHALIRITAPDRPPKVEDLLRPEYTLGRGDPNGSVSVDFEVPGDPYLSRLHFRLFRDDSGWRVENHSPNGTLVNGRSAEGAVRLKGRDRIEAGEGTKVEFLVLTDSEREVLLHGESAAPAAKEAPKKKSLFSKPFVWVLLGVYGLLAVFLLSAGEEPPKSIDPGPGPYFKAIWTRPLPRPEGVTDPAGTSARIWAAALAEHSGDLLTTGDHAWQLLQVARRAFGLRGFSTLDEAVDKDPQALEAKKAYETLDGRVTTLYKDARAMERAGRRAEALAKYLEILAAVPDNAAPIRRYAAARASVLSRSPSR